MPIYNATDFIKKGGRTPTRGVDTDFADNFASSFNAFAENSMFISKQSNTIEETQRVIGELSKRGVSDSNLPTPPLAGSPLSLDDRSLSDQVKAFFSRVRDLGEENPALVEGLPKSEGDLNRIIAEEAVAAQETAEEVAFRSSTLGTAGAFLGTAAAAVVDPPVMASMFLGAPVSAGILRTAAIEAGIGAAVEVPIQAGVQTTRGELGLSHGTEAALENIALAAAGGGIFGGAFRAIGMGGERVTAAVRDRLQARQAQAMADRRMGMAEQARRFTEANPDVIQTDADLKSAVNTAVRLDEIQSQNPFPRDVPLGERTFQETFDSLMTRVQNTGRVPAIQTNLPTRTDVSRSSFEARTIVQAAQAARRGGGFEADEATNAASLLGKRLGQIAQQRETTSELRRARTVIGRLIEDVEDPVEFGQTLKAANRLQNQADEVVRLEAEAEAKLTKGAKGAATRARNAFENAFRTEFPNASDTAPRSFLNGESDLAQGVEAIRRANVSDNPHNRPTSGILDLEEDQIAAALRQFARPLQEEVAEGRGFEPIRLHRIKSQAILKAQDTVINSLKAFLRDDLDANMPVRTVDEAGNVRQTNIENVLRDLDEDRKVTEAIQACVGGT